MWRPFSLSRPPSIPSAFELLFSRRLQTEFPEAPLNGLRANPATAIKPHQCALGDGSKNAAHRIWASRRLDRLGFGRARLLCAGWRRLLVVTRFPASRGGTRNDPVGYLAIQPSHRTRSNRKRCRKLIAANHFVDGAAAETRAGLDLRQAQDTFGIGPVFSVKRCFGIWTGSGAGRRCGWMTTRRAFWLGHVSNLRGWVDSPGPLRGSMAVNSPSWMTFCNSAKFVIFAEALSHTRSTATLRRELSRCSSTRSLASCRCRVPCRSPQRAPRRQAHRPGIPRLGRFERGLLDTP